ncbi:hypothetical protein MMC25_003496 [Agyrium rufum]|nr:hypothetical protein [Agyrium rufum]
MPSHTFRKFLPEKTHFQRPSHEGNHPKIATKDGPSHNSSPLKQHVLPDVAEVTNAIAITQVIDKEIREDIAEPARQESFSSTIHDGNAQVEPAEAPAPAESAVILVESKELWDEAYQKLQSEHPKPFKKYKLCILNMNKNESPGAIVDIEKLDDDMRERHPALQIKKRIKTIREEDWTSASTVYKKIVNTVLFAKDFITSVARNEPHAAIAWAGVSMLLPLLLKPDQQRQAATKALVDVSDLLLEYRVIEMTFRGGIDRMQTTGSSIKESLNKLISNPQGKFVNLYTQILIFQMRMAYYYSRHSVSRYMRDLITSDDWQTIQTEIDETDKNIKQHLQVIGEFHYDHPLRIQSREL